LRASRRRVYRRSERRRRQTDANVLHAPPDARAGEGVPLQPLPDAAPAHRGRAPAVAHRAPNQNLVPEQADEVEEGLPAGARRRQGRPAAAAAAAAAEYVTSGAAASPPSPPPAGAAQHPSAARAHAPLPAAARRRPRRHVLLQ